MGELFRKHPGAEAIRDGLWAEWKITRGLGPDRALHPKSEEPKAAKPCSSSTASSTPSKKIHASEHLHELHAKVKTFLQPTS